MDKLKAGFASAEAFINAHHELALVTASFLLGVIVGALAF